MVAKNYVVSTVWKALSEWMEYSICSVWGAHDLLRLSQKSCPLGGIANRGSGEREVSHKKR